MKTESIPLFFISTIMVWITEVILLLISRTWYDTTSIALSLLLSGFVGGLLAGNPFSGAFAGFLGGVIIFGTTDVNPFWWLYLLSTFGGLTGGLLRPIIFRKGTDEERVVYTD